MPYEVSNSKSNRSQEHDRLRVFLGQWHAEGVAYAPRGRVEKWVSDEIYEWLPGQFFMLQRWDAIAGTSDFKGLGIINFDPATGAYMTRSYVNLGFIRDYVTRVEGNVWTFTGEKERARIEFTNDGNTQRVNWEWRPDGDLWVPLCDRVATKAGGLRTRRVAGSGTPS
jgi:hypothetical protein